jgi:glutamyl-tRNA synthetase
LVARRAWWAGLTKGRVPLPSFSPRTRFAPSPTGDLHLGGAWTALASWVVARLGGGVSVLRVEDLDTPRVVAGSQARMEDDLLWLGLSWDEGPAKQSERLSLYEHAVARLIARGLVYACDCSRAEIARAASAPHVGQESPETIYPGTCRDRDPSRPMKRPPALRFRVKDELLSYEDGGVGRVGQRLDRDVGDFVLKRGDGLFAYQLAVVVDDLAMNITHVVRGADLAPSTPRQIALAQALGGTPPRYTHVPLVVGSDGARLEKRTPGVTVRQLRAAGVTAERIVGELACGLGLTKTSAPISPPQIVRLNRGARVLWRRDAWPIPSAW